MRVRTLVLSVAMSAAVLLVAQQTHAITVIPPSIELGGERGETIKASVTLFNESTSVITVDTSTLKVTSMNEQGEPIFAEQTTAADLATWIKVDKGPYTILPLKRMDVPIEIAIPSNADPGGHYASIVFTEKPQETDAGGSQVTVLNAVTSNLLLRVAGDIRESGSVKSFVTSDGKTNYSHLPISFVTMISNDGNVHFKPTGKVTVRNMLGGTTTVIPFNETNGIVLPHSQRKVDVTWEKEPASGTGFFGSFSNEWKNFALGPYTVELALTYGQLNDKTLSETVRVFVFPWRVLLLSVIVIVLVIWLIVMVVRQYNKWIIRQANSKGKKNPADDASNKQQSQGNLKK